VVISKPVESRPWFNRLACCFGPLPDNYFVFDVETTGLDTKKDLITQVGFCRVDDRKSVMNGSLMLDWTKDSRVDHDWFKSRLRNCEAEMRSLGKACHATYDRVTEEGLEPTEILQGFAALLREAKGSGKALLGHNVWRFDIPLLERHFKTYISDNFTFPPDAVWDTGMIEKARQLEMLPVNGVSRHSFFAQVYNCRGKGLSWSLDRGCVPNYELVDKHALDLSQAHEAGFDCFICHLVFEEQRALMNGVQA